MPVRGEIKWHGHFRSRDENGGHSRKPLPVDAYIAKLCAIELEFLTKEVLNAVRGHSRLPISVPMESPYTTSS